MDRRRNIRRLAMQLLYAIDQGRLGLAELNRAGANESLPPADAVDAEPIEPAPTSDAAANNHPPDRAALLASIDAEFDAEEEVHHAAIDLALTAWGWRDNADTVFTELAPDWPTHRQPPVDRAILRLAYAEIATGQTPLKVAINEAVELAKAYAGEESPMFINGVLDKAAKRLPTPAAREPADAAPPNADAWLSDAVDPQP